MTTKPPATGLSSNCILLLSALACRAFGISSVARSPSLWANRQRIPTLHRTYLGGLQSRAASTRMAMRFMCDQDTAMTRPSYHSRTSALTNWSRLAPDRYHPIIEHSQMLSVDKTFATCIRIWCNFTGGHKHNAESAFLNARQRPGQIFGARPWLHLISKNTASQLLWCAGSEAVFWIFVLAILPRFSASWVRERYL